MNPTDIARDFAVRFADAWNRHDMDELASLFREDASFVNVVGVRMDGREEIRRTHAKVHDGPYRASRLVVEVEAAREIPPAVIVAELRTQISGDERAPGQVRDTRLMLVLDDRRGVWGIAAGQNTFVATPPSGAPTS
jgi:uncharacterized protein (TIGR02246 family)